MATTAFKTPSYLCSTVSGGSTYKSRNIRHVCLVSGRLPVILCRIYRDRSGAELPSLSVRKYLIFASDGETGETKSETRVKDRFEGSESEFESQTEVEWTTDCAVGVDASVESDDAVVDKCSSAVIAHLNLYKEALANKDEAKATEVESLLKSLEEEKNNLEKKAVALAEELSHEKDRVLRISVGFDNFRKRTEKERLSLVSNAQGEVVESLLPVLDNFERAKAQIKVETEGEEKINNSYQSINKQFVEILASLCVVPVETVEKPFDPMVSSRASSEFSHVVDELFEKLYKVCARFVKTWIRI